MEEENTKAELQRACELLIRVENALASISGDICWFLETSTLIDEPSLDRARLPRKLAS